MNYTKGDWVSDNGDSEMWGVFEEKTGKAILYIGDFNGHNFIQNRPFNESKSNAQLIAASPMLYEALKAIEGYLIEQKTRRNKKSFADQRAGSDAEDLLSILQQALAKAEGKEK